MGAARYSGHGSTLDAANFAGYQPTTTHDDDIRWAGYPFTSGYEEWCSLSRTGMGLVCTRKQGWTLK